MDTLRDFPFPENVELGEVVGDSGDMDEADRKYILRCQSVVTTTDRQHDRTDPIIFRQADEGPAIGWKKRPVHWEVLEYVREGEPERCDQ